MVIPQESQPQRVLIQFDIDSFSRQFVRESSDAIVYADNGRIIWFWNTCAARVLGFAAAEASGQSAPAPLGRI